MVPLYITIIFHIIYVLYVCVCVYVYMGFSGGAVVKNLPADAGDTGLISELERPTTTPPPPEEEMATHSSTLAWEITWTEELGWLLSMGAQSWTRLSNCAHTRARVYIYIKTYTLNI